MAKVAMIQRELKREKLAAKYAAKYAELKAIAGDVKRSDEERRRSPGSAKAAP
jgi:small subunit ribosomal protein S14